MRHSDIQGGFLIGAAVGMIGGLVVGAAIGGLNAVAFAALMGAICCGVVGAIIALANGVADWLLRRYARPAPPDLTADYREADPTP